MDDAVRKKLVAFLDRSCRYAFEWGEHDCMLDIADWIDFACGTRIATEWRDYYASEAECDALLNSLGGFETAMRDEASRVELEETATPLPGDVGLLTIAGQPKMLGGIMMASGRWRVRTLTGFVVTSAVTVVVAWSLPCRP